MMKLSLLFISKKRDLVNNMRYFLFYARKYIDKTNMLIINRNILIKISSLCLQNNKMLFQKDGYALFI